MNATRTIEPDPERLLAHDAFVRGLARHLVRDPHGAEDVVQETWFASMRRPPQASTPEAQRGWLASVVRRLVERRRRGDRRERARQEAAARDERVPSTAEIVAREALRAEVVKAVLELDPPYRDVVLLRWFEHLPPRAIARRLDLPIETVRTRQKRALSMLRARLDRHADGDRAAWSALILAYAPDPGPLAVTTAAAQSLVIGGVAMSTHAKLAAVAALVGIVLFATLRAPERVPLEPDAAPESARAPVELEAAAPPDRDARDVALVPAAGDARASVAEPPAPAATTATVSVSAVWSDDTPAADVIVEIARADLASELDEPRRITDAEGRARFESVAPGSVYTVLRRGDVQFGDTVKLAAGETREVRIVIDDGIDLRGIVLDERRAPVAGAEILVCDWGGGEALALGRSGADGRFALRDVGSHCHVGARATGFAASALRMIAGRAGSEIDFEIVLADRALELSGTVLDERGAPVRGARVRAGDTQQKLHELPGGGRAMSARPDLTRSDAHGRFAFRHLRAGRVPLAVSTATHAPWIEDVELVADRASDVTVRLEAGVVVSGTVRDERGQPVARADVSVGEWDDLGQRRTRSAADGAYRLEGLAAGSITLRVDSDSNGKAEPTLQASPGESLTFDPVLSRGLEQSGRVVDANGEPVKHAMVEAQLQPGARSESWFAFENTGEDGRFVLKNCPSGSALRIQVRRKSTFPEVTLTDVVPSADELVVRLPKEAWIHIRGRVLGPDDRPLQNVSASILQKGHNSVPAETVDAATGEFRYGPYPPSEYSLYFQVAGFPAIQAPWRAVGPDEEWDLGTLRFVVGGTVRVSSSAQDAALVKDVFVAIQDADGETVDSLDVTDGSARSEFLPPGNYVLQVRGPVVACTRQEFAVRAGSETVLDLPLQKGSPVVISCAPTAASVPARQPDVVVRDATGRFVLRAPAWPGEGAFTVGCALAPGRYRVEVSTRDERGSTEFDVPADADGSVNVRVPLSR